MIRVLSVCLFCLCALLITSLNAQEVNVTGDWELTSTTPRGERTRPIHFEQEGEKIIVTMEGMGGEEIKGEGTIKGNEIEWTITRSTPRGEFTLTYKGTVEGDTMKGQVEMGEMGSMEWTAKKK